MSTVTDTSRPAGSVLVAGRYRLVEGLGSGGAAAVYRARDEVLGRDVAVKVFHDPSMAADELARQEREIAMLSTLAHPGLLAVYDAGRERIGDRARRFLVMELVTHDSLDRRLRESGPLPPHEVAALGAQVADALAYVHARGVVHRDVKPANILISDLGSSGFRRLAKLGDFGIAHLLDSQRLTSDGTILGTAAYLSPEQVTGSDIGPATDVYALGLTLLEALTGEQEFTGTVMESAVARMNRAPRVPDELADEWRMVLRAMTAKDPERRPSAREVAEILGGKPSVELTGTGRRSTERTRRERRDRAKLALAITLVVVGFGLSFALGWFLNAVIR